VVFSGLSSIVTGINGYDFMLTATCMHEGSRLFPCSEIRLIRGWYRGLLSVDVPVVPIGVFRTD
jgi:hypothetical protein